MSEGPEGSPPQGRRRGSSGEEVREVLTEFIEDQKEREQRRRPADRPDPERRQRLMMAAAMLLAIASFWVWISPPAFMRPGPILTLSPEGLEAGLRMDLYVTALRIEEHLDERGRLPGSLQEALEDAPDPEDLVYSRVSDDRYILVGSRGNVSVTYDSREPVAELVRGARQQVEAGAGRRGA